MSLFEVRGCFENHVSLCLHDIFSLFFFLFALTFCDRKLYAIYYYFGNYYYYKSKTFFYYYYSRIPKILLLLPHVCHSQSYNFSDRMTCKIFIVQSLLSLSAASISPPNQGLCCIKISEPFALCT